MELQEQVTITEKKVKLVDGTFTPGEALDILNNLINQKINYHKIEKLQQWEQNHNLNEKPYINRLQELEADKKAINSFITDMMQEGKRLSICGVLTIKAID